jgi:pimeloyl-ACP methyl ester carboxylesterase
MHSRLSEGPGTPVHPKVVLVHGYVVSSRYMVPTVERLAPHLRVHAPDLPGFGRSEGTRRALDVPGLAEALAVWMEASGIESAILVGNSMGCQVITELAARHPERVEGMVLQGPTMDPRARTVAQQAARLLVDSTREPPSLLPIMALDYLSIGFRRSLGTLLYALQDRIEDRLPLLQVPALVVRGSRDPIVPRRWAREVAGLLPEGRLAEVPDAAHAMNYDAPQELARITREFSWSLGGR